MDLYIHIFDKKFTLSLYDRPDDVSFTIVRMPRASSTIESSVFYSSIVTNGLRTSRETTEGSSFFMSCLTIVQRTIKQGAKKPKIGIVIRKFRSRHLYEFHNITSESKF